MPIEVQHSSLMSLLVYIPLRPGSPAFFPHGTVPRPQNRPFRTVSQVHNASSARPAAVSAVSRPARRSCRAKRRPYCAPSNSLTPNARKSWGPLAYPCELSLRPNAQVASLVCRGDRKTRRCVKKRLPNSNRHCINGLALPYNTRSSFLKG